MRYRLRCFYSKGAFLVLIWIALVSVASWSCICLHVYSSSYQPGWNYHLSMLPAVSVFVFAPLVGWLADSKFGNFKMFRIGVFLLFLAVLTDSICTILRESVPFWSFILISVISTLTSSLGTTACVLAALQLGLDQMPDASSSNCTSFINWFCFSIGLGLWLCDSLWFVLDYCVIFRENWEVQLFSLLPVICMSIVCCTVFLLAPKWMTIEPNSPQSMKTIYQILKFAVKHKAPLNRSALTYWEENIPSRLDLGKLRYGGPFTTEQVEDVKIFFKIIVIALPWLISSVPVPFQSFIVCPVSDLNNCQSAFLYIFTYSPFWCGMLVIILTEFIVYPLIKIEPPSILKRIGFTCFVISLMNAGYLTLYVIRHFYHLQLSPWVEMVYSIYYGSFVLACLMSLTMQFVCAQSPYHLRGLLSGYLNFLHVISIGIGVLLVRLTGTLIITEYKEITQWSLAAALSLIGLILHCVLAHWYKRRVRDEDYDVHRVVEEVYDRYLSHVH